MTEHLTFKPTATPEQLQHVNAKLTTTAQPGHIVWGRKEEVPPGSLLNNPALDRQLRAGVARFHELPEWYRKNLDASIRD